MNNLTRLSVDISQIIRNSQQASERQSFVAEAADKQIDEKLISSVQPVKLDPKIDAQYNNIFFEKSRSIFVKEMMGIAEVTHRLNAFFAGMRKCLLDGRTLDHYARDQGKDALSNAVNGIFDDAYSFFTRTMAGKDSPLMKSMLDLVQSTMSGTRHILKKSEVYSGGVDVTLMKSVNDKGLICFDLAYGDLLPSNPHSISYESDRFQAYSTEFSLKVRAAAIRIMDHVFGVDPIATSSKPIFVSLPLTYNFQEIQAIFEAETGIKLGTQFFTLLGGDSVEDNSKGKKVRTNIEDYIRIGFVLSAEQRAEHSRQGLLAKEQISGVDLSMMQNTVPAIEEKLKAEVTEEAQIFNRKVVSTLTFTFNKKLAAYICQSKDGSIDFATFDNWFHIWSSQFLRKPKGRYAGTSISGGRLKLSNIPRYSLPVSQLDEITKLRRDMKMSVEETRGNEDGLYLTPSGTIAYLPTTTERSNITVIKEYEELSNSIANICAQYGISKDLLNSNYLAIMDTGISYEEFVKAQDDLKKLSAFKDTVLGYDWDSGLRIMASDRPGILKSHVEIGAVRPDNLAIADYLGYNLAREGERPLQKTFADSMVLMTVDDPIGDETASRMYGSANNADEFVRSDLFKEVINTYSYYAEKGSAPFIADVVRSASLELGLADAPDDVKMIHRQFFNPETEEFGYIDENKLQQQHFVFDLVSSLMSRTLHAVSGNYGSYLYQSIAKESPDNVMEEVEEHPHYFLASKSPANHFARTYNYLGGNVYKRILDYVNNLTTEQLTEVAQPIKKQVPTRFHTAENPSTTEVEFKRPSSNILMKFVKPHSTMFGKYAPNYEFYEQQADRAVESISKDDSIDVDDIHFAGSSSKFCVFPHQLDAHKSLRKPEPPPFAVLDIAPGGGKTATGLSDMASIVKDLQEVGRVRPLVLCPDSLVRNWCDDMKAFSDGSWNMIPLTTDTFDRWGPEKLRNLIENAPTNTIVVAGFNFLRGRPLSMVIGTAVTKMITNLEFVRSFEFNYIIIDESHKLKNKSSARHNVVKQLTTSSFVKYLRIASGTLIADRVRDIEGQVALYSPHIFRSGELVDGTDDDNDSTVTLGGESVNMWKVNSPQQARRKLSRYASVITKKKKDWAFMLPSPIERFHAVGFYDDGEDDSAIEMGKLHQELYNTVVDESVEALQELLGKAKRARNNDDDDDDGEDDSDSQNFDMEEGDELAGIAGADLDAYIQRIERLIIAPEKDPLYATVFGSRSYVSRKAKKIASIIKEHFDVPLWERGRQYREYELVSYNDRLFLSRKVDLDSPARRLLPDDSVGVTPDVADSYWREEPEGKVLVFCRYTNSVNATYDALPDEYKKMAVKYTGEETDKVGNLERFKRDPKIKILIANEQGMSEGHNLQIASRMIRVESPWGPGELDQSASRVFRPDPKGASEGAIYRESIFLDWVLADNTMEVAKQGRLISKVMAKARFDEAENPLYDDVLSTYLPEVSMGLDLLQTRPSLEEYSNYVEAYASLNAVTRREFHDMRTQMSTEMIPVPKTEQVKGARIIDVPFIVQQDIPDRNGWKPSPLAALMHSEDGIGARFAKDLDTLIGTPVLTDQGNGMIVSFTKRKDGGISSVQVKIKDSEELVRLPPGLVFVPTSISATDVKKNFEVSLAYTTKQLRKEERDRKEIEELEAQRAAEEEAKSAKEKRSARQRKDAVDLGEQRKRNVREGKPINQGVKPSTKVEVPKGVKADETFVEPLTLAPAYYHGYLTLESDSLSYAKQLKKFGFKEYGEYAFLTISRRNQANAVMDYVEDNFDLSKATIDRLSAVFGAFEKGKRGLYNLELAPISELPHFFAVNKRIVKNRKEARIYPFFMHDKLMLVVDVATSPIIRRHLNKAVPGAATKWQLSPGALMYFAKNKADLKSKVAALKRAKFNIANVDILNKEVAAIQFRNRSK